jgi:hypothetical protein
MIIRSNPVYFKLHENSVPFNHGLAKVVGIEAAVLFAELVLIHYSMKKYNETDEKGMFHVPQKALEESISLKRRGIDSAIVALKENHLLFTETKGAPCKRYFGFPTDLQNRLDLILNSNTHE